MILPNCLRRLGLNCKYTLHCLIFVYFSFVVVGSATDGGFKLNELEYFEQPASELWVFQNWYDGNFSDSKISSLEMVHHGERIVTNGDIRLSPTPAQWDPIPTFSDRVVSKKSNSVTANLSYPSYGFEYSIRVQSEGEGLKIEVILENPVPDALVGKAGLNLEFIPSAFMGKGYLADGDPGIFPAYPSGNMEKLSDGVVTPTALKTAAQWVIAPEDPNCRILIKALNGAEISLYDGRSQAQNGWFVIRSLLPQGKTGSVLQWYVEVEPDTEWYRKPVVGYSQVGYPTNASKVAVVELDPNTPPGQTIELLKLDTTGQSEVVKSAVLSDPKRYLRYDYVSFDFSDVTSEGLYCFKGADQTTGIFPINQSVYSNAWQPTIDLYFPIQMDHMRVDEAYRTWHGASHLDDALQAPINHEHFDLYAQGPTTDTDFEPGEHIPGLNYGGWYDAGDYDIRTQTQYRVVKDLVSLLETFGLTRDQTTVDWAAREVTLHQPDGDCDFLQQIEHGTLALIAQHRAVGHAIPGIVAAHLHQYHHLGDGITKTDNMIYDSSKQPLESDGIRSGQFDDRWAFTNHTSALNYGSAAALAAASRALKTKNPDLAAECLQTASKVWAFEQSNEPATFRVGNTTGGRLDGEMLNAAAELFKSTGEEQYLTYIEEHIPEKIDGFVWNMNPFLDVYSDLDPESQNKIRQLALAYPAFVAPMIDENPYGVPITRGGWAGNGFVVRFGVTGYKLHKLFPDVFDGTEAIRSLNYLLGCHPDSNLSFVSAVGAQSKKVAYGMNRADFSFLPGGIVPGVLVLKPDYPENKEDWPFFWGQNEYVISMGAPYITLVHAVMDLHSAD